MVRLLTPITSFHTLPLLTMIYSRHLASLEDLIRHGLHALRETLQQDKELNINNTSIGLVGPASTHEKAVPPSGPFRILEGDTIQPFLDTMIAKDTGALAAPASAPAAVAGDEDVQMSG